MAAAKLVRAVGNFATVVGKVERLVHAGEVFKATDPIVKRAPELFEPAGAVEQATAAPGERRNR